MNGLAQARTTRNLLIVLPIALIAIGAYFPKAMFLLNISLCYGLVVLGMLLLMRTGLVSFGHGLYYCLGAYAAGTLDKWLGSSDLLLLLIAGITLTAMASLLLGLLLRKYRGIFFSMLSLAFSMILYGLLVKTQGLGSSDGFNVAVPKTIASVALAGNPRERLIIFVVTVLVSFGCAALLWRYLGSHRGRLAHAIRDNELRVEYMGASVANTVHMNYVISAVLTGIGGALAAINVGHIDPEMSYWTTSGEFVFVAILSGTGNVLAPFMGSVIFEGIRSLAYQYSPNTWQMALGTTMLLVIMFLPEGLWSVFARRKATS
jgi:ABC-type branched-subunit amino acid transport system permease subunit